MPDTTKYRALLATVLEEEGLTLHGLTPFAPLEDHRFLPCGLPPPGEALRGSDDPVSLPVPGTGANAICPAMLVSPIITRQQARCWSIRLDG